MYIIYGTPRCPDCTAAVTLLSAKGIEHSYHDLTKDPVPSRAKFEELAGRPVRTAPIVIQSDHPGPGLSGDEVFIGGFKDLKELIE